ncbi:MAG: SpaA isopeptide-forming pilin-related protein [Christensenellaceae bacterium]|nr:SpaA isopeptide-forming pilin-related protein [Christensenellaceae bacterium]
MKDTVKQFVGQAKRNRSRKKRAAAVLMAMSLVVATGVTWSLHSTGVSKSTVTYCGIAEHTHTEDCETKTLVCGYGEASDSETAGHTHTDSCYEEQKVLTCGLEENEGHTHSDSCYTTERVLTCGQEESGAASRHVHTDSCYETEYTCGFEQEHTHTLACYSNPKADLETAADWEKTFAEVELSGKAGEDVVAIAKTQLGYAESTDNYKVETVDGAEVTKGYTRYGEWYGDEYGDWCAMFASFCLHYANVEYPTESSCAEWVKDLKSVTTMQAWSAPEAWTPAIGDLIFFDRDGDGTPDHVGIVSALTAEGAELTADADVSTADGIKTIEGNSNDKVEENSYTLKDESIVGYGILPVEDEKAVGKTENVKTAQCGEYTVTVAYGDDAGIPEGAELTVSPADTVSTPEELAEMLDTDAANSKTTSSLVSLDISFVLNGEKIEPAEGSAVRVQIALTGDLEVAEGSELNIIHHKNDGTSEVIGDVEVTDGEDSTLSFTTDSFSTYEFVLTSDAGEGVTTYAVAGEGDYSYKVGKSNNNGNGAVSGIGVVNFYIAYNSNNPNAGDKTTWVTTGVSASMYGTQACQTTLNNTSASWNGVCTAAGSDGATGDTAVANDKTIREQAAGTFTVPVGSTKYSVMIDDFPDDEEIFSAIRSKSGAGITVGETTYALSDITEDKFDIKWIVVKHRFDDGWHVDGILVRKTASLTVKKTFVGDTDAISAVAGNSSSYKINVNNKDYSLSDATKSEDGNTYTWVVTGLTPGKDYTVTESGYEATNYLVSSSYAVTNSSASANDGTGTGTSATANAVRSYRSAESSENYQTVAFTNVYTKPYIMTILKRDSTTSNPLSGVEFDLTVTKEGDVNQTSVITSGANGTAAIDFSSDGLGGEGTYTFSLKEQANQGYEALPEVTGKVTVDSTGKVTVSELKCGVEGNNTLVSLDEDTATIYVDNKAERAKITVTKTWNVTNDSDKKPVTVQLLRDGAEVAGATVELSSSNKWTTTWSDLPYYVDGKVAYYTVRETWIGTAGSGTAYNTNADPTDGYADYIVSQSTVSGTETATDDDGKSYTVYTSTISLTNTPDNGQVVITKVEKDTKAPLAGAVFTVYSDANCETAVSNATFTSGEDGKVTISGLNTGTYYVKETKAPNGYALEDTVYTLKVQARNSTLTLNDKAVTTVTNERRYARLTITKTETGADNKTLAGAEFTLQNAENKYYSGISGDGGVGAATWSDTETSYPTGKNGTLTFGGLLTAGEYTLTETKAPDGYNKLTESIKIIVDSEGKISASMSDNKPIKVTSTALEGGIGYSNSFDVENSTGQQLPHTGGAGTTMFTLGGLALMAGALVYGCGLRRRRVGRAD